MKLEEYDISPGLIDRLNKLENVKISALYGYCPVQAEGVLDGMEFYFRSRDNFWRIEVGIDRQIGGPPTWWYSELWPGNDGSAGWMTDEEALACVAKASERYGSSDRSRFLPGHHDYERTVLEGWSMRALRLVDVAALLKIEPQKAAHRATKLGIEVPWTAAAELDWIIKTGWTV